MEPMHAHMQSGVVLYSQDTFFFFTSALTIVNTNNIFDKHC